MTEEELLREAFMAGFNNSSEGFNGETMPNLAKENDALDGHFDKWYAENVEE